MRPAGPGSRKAGGGVGKDAPPRQHQLTPYRRPRWASAAFCAVCDRTAGLHRRRHLVRTSNASDTRPWRPAELPPWQRRRPGNGSALRTKFFRAKPSGAAPRGAGRSQNPEVAEGLGPWGVTGEARPRVPAEPGLHCHGDATIVFLCPSHVLQRAEGSGIPAPQPAAELPRWLRTQALERQWTMCESVPSTSSWAILA